MVSMSTSEIQSMSSEKYKLNASFAPNKTAFMNETKENDP